MLRYKGSQPVPGASGDAVELAAILDIVHKQVIGIEPFRSGDALTSWAWTEDGQLTVKGPDGVTSNFKLAEILTGQQARPANQAAASNQALAPAARRQSTAAAAPPPRKKKALTLFDLLFN